MSSMPSRVRGMLRFSSLKNLRASSALQRRYQSSQLSTLPSHSTLPLSTPGLQPADIGPIRPPPLPLVPSVPLAGAFDLLLDARHALAPKASLQPSRSA